jgi:hypothetical protein
MYRERIQQSEIVLLPGNIVTAIGVDRKLGPHTVVISGFVFTNVRSYDDDHLTTRDLLVDIEDIFWNPKSFLQASTMTSWGRVYSDDDDEVDHSGWGISVKTGHTDSLVAGKAVRMIRLKCEVSVKGDGNHWAAFGFQTFANGELLNPEDIRNSVNETKEIHYIKKPFDSHPL